MKRLEIVYLYRDASNNKQYESVVVENAKGLDAEAVKEHIRSQFKDFQCWPDIIHFQPEKLGWPTAFFDEFSMVDDDLTVHELDSVLKTEKPVTHSLNMS